MWKPNVNLATQTGSSVWDNTARKNYELNNHLGNVMAVITEDRDLNGGDIKPTLTSSQDYYSFGGQMLGRKGGLAYRYGFNGKENDNEVKGEGNQQDYGMRIYDPRIAKFLSVDPITAKYPELTPYQFASNSPVDGIDMDGLEHVGVKEIEGNPPIAAQSAFTINDFLANTFSSAMNLVNKPAEGRIIRRILRESGYSSSGLTDAELGEKFNIKMITGGTAENPQRGWTVLPTQSTLSEVSEYALGALGAYSVFTILKSRNSSMLLGTSGETSTTGIKNILRSLQISKRIKEIGTFDDVAGGKLDAFEAEGLAIFESSIGGRVKQSSHAGVDAVIFNNKSISHFGTGGRTLDAKGFKDWMNNAFKRHFLDKDIDYYLIDLRNMTKQQRNTVQDAVKGLGADVAKKTYTIQ